MMSIFLLLQSLRNFCPVGISPRRATNATNLDLDLVLVDLFGRHGSQEFAGDPWRHAWCNAASDGGQVRRVLNSRWEGWLVLGLKKEAQNRLKHQEI